MKELSVFIGFECTFSGREYDNPYVSFADPFADAAKGDEDGVQDGLVHIRIQQRNNRKTLTTIQGLSSEYDLKKIVRACKKVRKELPFFYLTRANKTITTQRYFLEKPINAL